MSYANYVNPEFNNKMVELGLPLEIIGANRRVRVANYFRGLLGDIYRSVQSENILSGEDGTGLPDLLAQLLMGGAPSIEDMIDTIKKAGDETLARSVITLTLDEQFKDNQEMVEAYGDGIQFNVSDILEIFETGKSDLVTRFAKFCCLQTENAVKAQGHGEAAELAKQAELVVIKHNGDEEVSYQDLQIAAGGTFEFNYDTASKLLEDFRESDLGKEIDAKMDKLIAEREAAEKADSETKH